MGETHAAGGGAPGRIFGLDVMRACAILLVLAAHALPPSLGSWELRSLRETCGVAGVEVFFVLSGFLIGGILVREVHDGRLVAPGGLLKFWRRRWWRTLPAFYLFLTMHVVAAIGGGHLATDGPMAAATALFVQNLAWSQGPFFDEAWSLAVEEWFYLSLPVALWMLSRWLRPGFAMWTAIGVFLVAPLLLRGFVADGEWDQQVRKVVVLRLDALMVGVAAAAVAHRWPARWSRLRPLAWLGAVAIVPALLCLGAQELGAVQPAWFRVGMFPWLSLSFACFLPAASAPWSPRGLLAACITEISLTSYSLYLSHMLLLRFLRWLARAVHWDGYHDSIGGAVLRFGLAFAIASVLYRVYERPTMSLRDRTPGVPVWRWLLRRR